MENTKIYFDNCCYNRPFDDLLNETVRQEAQAKMFIQSLVRYGSLSLVYSYMSIIEINDSPFEYSKKQILKYIEDYSHIYISSENIKQINVISADIMTTGIKNKDAIHLSCALIAECDFFITTDKRVLKYKNEKIRIINPINFVKIWGAVYDL